MLEKTREVQMSFSKRLLKAANDSPEVPPFGKGQQTFIAGKLEVSQEAVRKWFAGETEPRSRLSMELAELLDVKHSWLMLGTAHGEIDADVAAAKRHSAGVYGFMAFLESRGVSAKFLGLENDGDISFIHEGKQYDVAVEVGQSVDESQTQWIVKFKTSQLEARTNITFIELEGTSYSVAGYFLFTPSDVIITHGRTEGKITSLLIKHDPAGKVFRVENMILKKVLS